MSGDNEEQKDKRMDRTKGILKEIFHFCGNAAGLVSLLIVVFNGGAFKSKTESDLAHFNQRQDSIERRQDSMEQGGSAALREHTKMDDERVNDVRLTSEDTKKRVLRLEDAMVKIADLAGDVKVLTFKIDAVQKQLEKGKM